MIIGLALATWLGGVIILGGLSLVAAFGFPQKITTSDVVKIAGFVAVWPVALPTAMLISFVKGERHK